jgi:hypothetical protein
MLWRLLTTPIRGPKWARFDRLLQLQEQSAQLPYLGWYLHFYGQVPLSKRPLWLTFAAACLLALVAIVAPLLFQSHPRLIRGAAILCIAGFAFQMFLAWIRPKQRWPRFLTWARSNDTEASGDISFAEIVVPPFALTARHIVCPFAGLFIASIAGVGLPLGCGRIFDIPLDYSAALVWLYSFMFSVLAGPVLLPSLCLADSIYWWSLSKRLPMFACYVMPLPVLGVFSGLYYAAFSATFSRLDSTDPSAPFSAYFIFLSCIFCWAFSGGVLWWVSCWLAQKILVSCERPLTDWFKSQLAEYEATSRDA